MVPGFGYLLMRVKVVTGTARVFVRLFGVGYEGLVDNKTNVFWAGHRH